MGELKEGNRKCIQVILKEMLQSVITSFQLQIVPISNRFAPLADLKNEVSQNRRNVTTKKKTIERKQSVDNF
jgi:hypothetical protein